MKDGTMKMRLKNQKGTSVVEFAIVLPLLVLLLFGIIEFSILFYDKAMLTNASREGARTGIVYNYPERIPDSTIREVVKIYARDHLVTFSNNKLEDDDISISRTGSSSGDNLTVTASYQYDFLVFPGIIVGLFSGSMEQTLTLQAVTVMRLE